MKTEDWYSQTQAVGKRLRMKEKKKKKKSITLPYHSPGDMPKKVKIFRQTS